MVDARVAILAAVRRFAVALVFARGAAVERLTASEQTGVPQVPAAPSSSVEPPVPLSQGPTPQLSRATFARRDEIRLNVSRPFLQPGDVGIEIGAVAFPSFMPDGVRCENFDRLGPAELDVYFDGLPLAPTAPMDEIPRRFPDGADFLLAHNVLEHTPDPIGTLVGWLGHVKPGGFAIVSLPHHDYCPGDARRPLPSIEHLIIDYAMCEHAGSLASREHFIAGSVGWAADWPDVGKNEFANGVLAAAMGSEVEHHFHVWDDALAHDAVAAALSLHGVGREVAFASPSTTPSTVGDIIVVVELSGTPGDVPAVRAARDVLTAAAERLPAGAVVPPPSAR